ncbi:hypothetical protein BV20DRAFT_761910 [Pilatotrama ljubarskyi]|nr:hypothetical protein BV20DRAFT_761910 [Pilatotrama ljubarskyi]
MLSRVLAISLSFLVLISGMLADPISVDVPYPPSDTCNTVSLKWGGGTPPYNVTIAGYMGVRFFNDPNTTDTSASWVVNATGGTPAVVLLYDATGAFGASDFFIIGPSNDTSCLPDQGRGADALSPGAIAGIAVAAVVVCALALGLAIWSLIRKRRRSARRHGKQEVDLNESSLPPTAPQTSMKAALAFQHVAYDSQNFSDHAEDSTSSVLAIGPASSQSEVSVAARPSGVQDRDRGWLPTSPQPKQGVTPPRTGVVITDAAEREHVGAGNRRMQDALTQIAVTAEDNTPILEQDGGIRLAGGPIDELEATAATLPPPYRRY